MGLFRKQRYKLENFIYQKLYGKEIDFDDFRLKENTFSGKKLSIMYLTNFDGSFGINNNVIPLKKFGNLYRFEMTKKPHCKTWYHKKEQINQEMLKFVQKTMSEVKIDVILCYLAGYNTTPKVLKEIRNYNVPMINECLDDEFKFRDKIGKDGHRRGMQKIAKYFDLCLTSSKSAIVKYLVEGSKPLIRDYGVNEKIYKNLGLPKKYDVGFVGADYGIRRKYIKFLQANGVNVYAKGEGWENGFADSNEMIEIFCQSKIVLGFSTVGKKNEIFILKGRDFEVPFTGSFYITGYHNDLKDYFELGKDIETYKSKEELLQKVQYYLNNEQEREKIAQTGYTKCLENYTSKKTYEKIFGYLGL